MHQEDTRCQLCENEYETAYAVRDGALFILMAVLPPVIMSMIAGFAAGLGVLTIAFAGVGLVVTVTVFPRLRRRLAGTMRKKFLNVGPLPQATLLKS